jgi:hypothetical protein
MLTGVPTAEFDAAGGYQKVYDLAKSSGADMGRPSAQAVMQYAPSIGDSGNQTYKPGFDLAATLAARGVPADQIQAATIDLKNGEVNYYQQAQDASLANSPGFTTLQAKYDALMAKQAAADAAANTPSTPGTTKPVTGSAVTPGSTYNPSAAVGTHSGLINSADTLGSLVTQPLSQTGASGLLTANMLAKPQAAQVAMPAGTPATTGWNFGTAKPTPGVDTWVNATTGQRMTYPTGSVAPGTGWTKL